MAHHPSTLPAVLAPVITPFDVKGAPDARRLAHQCRWLLSHRVGLAIFGTNSEANSMSVAERIQTLQALIEAGLPADQMMPGSGACAVTDAITLTRAAVEADRAQRATMLDDIMQLRKEFEAWMRIDNTFPLDRDPHGYADSTTALLWHVWLAATKNLHRKERNDDHPHR